jgi:hypothetical protein
VLWSCMDWGATSFIRSPDTDRLCQDKGLGVTLCNPWMWHPHSCSARSPAEQHSTHMCWVLELEPCQWQGPQAEQVQGGGTKAGAPLEWRFSNLRVMGTSPGSATMEAAPNAVTF